MMNNTYYKTPIKELVLRLQLHSIHRLVFSFLLLTLLSACSSFSGSQLFTNYNQQIEPVRNALQRNDMVGASNLLPTLSPNNVSYALNQLEKGRVMQLNQNFEQSKYDFEVAMTKIEEQNFAAAIEISKGLETTASFLTNDNVREYFIPFYEQTMVHTLQAMNFVALNDIESALVEIRRANLVQQQALKANTRSLEKAALSANIDLNHLYTSYPSMDSIIGNVKNGFQNAFTFYYSGFLYEAIGEYNAAYIDYKRAIEIFPDNTYLQDDLLRLAKYLAFDNEYDLFKKQFNREAKTQNHRLTPVLIVFEQGLIPEKIESRIDLPIFTSRNDMRFYSVAMPSYVHQFSTSTALNVNIDNKQLTSEPIVNLSSLAAKDLKDRMPGIVARQVTRLIAKEEFRQSAARNGGDIGNIIATLYNLASERADTRSWLTLANNYQVAKTYLPDGEYPVELVLNGKKHPITLNATAKKSLIVKVVSIGETFNITVNTI